MESDFKRHRDQETQGVKEKRGGVVNEKGLYCESLWGELEIYGCRENNTVMKKCKLQHFSTRIADLMGAERVFGFGHPLKST